jgi:hypothetical protein
VTPRADSIDAAAAAAPPNPWLQPPTLLTWGAAGSAVAALSAAIIKLHRATVQLRQLQATAATTAQLDTAMAAARASVDDIRAALAATAGGADGAGADGNGHHNNAGVPADGAAGTGQRRAVAPPPRQLDAIMQYVQGMRVRLETYRSQRRGAVGDLDALLRRLAENVEELRVEGDLLASPERRADRAAGIAARRQWLDELQRTGRLSGAAPELSARTRQAGGQWWHPPREFFEDGSLVNCVMEYARTELIYFVSWGGSKWARSVISRPALPRRLWFLPFLSPLLWLSFPSPLPPPPSL